MQYLNIRKAIGLILALAFFTGGSQFAFAAGTASGTNITNTATVDYQVGGDSRSASGSDTGFVIDNRVDLTVVNTDAANNVNVAPAQTNRVLTYTVTNTGNTAQGYQLNYEPIAPTVMTNVRVYVDDPDSGTVGSWDASDPQYIVGTTGNFASLFSGSEFTVEGTANQGLNHDNGSDGTTTFTVFIVADTPAAATNGQTEAYNLLATTLNSGTNTVTTETAATAAAVEAVFADAAGTYTGDIATDGRHSATGNYTVTSAALAVAKTVLSTTDEFGTGYAIPGANVVYQIRITNSGPSAADANTVSITDQVPANTQLCITTVGTCTAPSFTDGATTSGLALNAFQYSNDATATPCEPGDFTYTPSPDALTGYDSAVTCIRMTTTGSMNGSGGFFDMQINVGIQ